MLHSFIQVQELVEQKLKTIEFKQTPQSLYDNVNYIMGIGGKRVRPVMCLMANELFAEMNDDAWNAALAIEIFHNFTLVHDDIMDNAPLRRGQTTVHEKTNLPTAILTGDVMNIVAYEYLNKIHHTNLSKVLEVFNTTAKQVCEGQQLDMDFEKQDHTTIDEYINMIRLKTSVLLACAMKIGAILGGATDGTANTLYNFGKNLGIAFQLKDDYLDAFGESASTGKQVGGDILSNKKTFLLLKAFEKADAQQKDALNELLASNLPDKVNLVLHIFEQLEIKKEAQTIKELYTKKAFDNLAQLPVQESRKVEIKKLAEYLLLRES